MGKFYGVIGYAETAKDDLGVYKPAITEKHYYGDITKNFRRLESSGNVNDNINVANVISIVADPFANENFHAMRYVVYMGTKWKITNVEVQPPRLILTIGGVYNDVK